MSERAELRRLEAGCETCGGRRWGVDGKGNSVPCPVCNATGAEPDHYPFLALAAEWERKADWLRNHADGVGSHARQLNYRECAAAVRALSRRARQ